MISATAFVIAASCGYITYRAGWQMMGTAMLGLALAGQWCLNVVEPERQPQFVAYPVSAFYHHVSCDTLPDDKSEMSPFATAQEAIAGGRTAHNYCVQQTSAAVIAPASVAISAKPNPASK